MAISSDLQQFIHIQAKEVLPETMALTSRVQKNITSDAGGVGQRISMGAVTRGTGGSASPSNAAPALTTNNVGSRYIDIDTLYSSDVVSVSGTDFQNYNLNSVFGEQVKECMRQVAYAVNASMNALYKKIPGIAGTATQSLFNNGTAASIDTLADVYKQLRLQNANPANFDLITTISDEAAAKKVTALQLANQRGSDDVNVYGSAGKVQGFNLFADHQVAKHTVGSITTGLVAKASTAVAVGSTSFAATTAASTGACALKTGDSITIGSDVYVLAADATQASASTDVTLTILYGLKTALAGGEAITLTTGLGTCYQSIAGDLSGIGLAARKPAESIFGQDTLGDKYEVVEVNSGFPMTLVMYSNDLGISFRCLGLYGVGIMNEDKLVRAQTHA